MRGGSAWSRKVLITGGQAFDKEVSTEALWIGIQIGIGEWPLLGAR